MKQVVFTSQAPAAIGPYSQAIRAGEWLFLSGQIPVDPATGEVAGTDVRTQARQVLKNIQAVLAEAGTTVQAVVKTTVFLSVRFACAQAGAARFPGVRSGAGDGSRASGDDAAPVSARLSSAARPVHAVRRLGAVRG